MFGFPQQLPSMSEDLKARLERLSRYVPPPPPPWWLESPSPPPSLSTSWRPPRYAEVNGGHLRELDLPDVGVDQAGAARLLQAVRRNGELARLDLRRNELPPKVVKMLAKQARGFRKESDDDVPLELLLEPQEKSAAQ